VRRSIIAALGLLVFAGVRTAAAQAPAGPGGQPAAPAGEIRGKVLEGKSELPIARASVSVRVKGSTTILTGGFANEQGDFRITNLRPGTYSMRTTYIGFTPIVQEVVLTTAAPVVTVAPIKLVRVAVELSAVSVQEERATVVTEPDRTTYRAKDVAPAAANASDVLDAVPAVQVDGDGRVSLRGNENVAVQINGRPTPMRGAQLAAYLKTLPSNTIERVEVVPNPSAKHDPEGMAGIINIVLKQNVDLGLSMGFNGAMSQTDRFFGSGNLGYQVGKLSSFTTLGLNRDARNIVGLNDRERYDAARTLMSYSGEDIDADARQGGLNVTTTLDYQRNRRDLLSNALTLNKRFGEDASMNYFAEQDGGGALTDSYYRPKDSNISGWIVDYNVAFKRVFEPRKHEINTEFRFNRQQDNDENELWRLPATSTTRTEGELQVTDAASGSLTAQLDYVRTLAPRTKLETGYKGTMRSLDRDYDVTKDALGDGNWVASPLSNAFTFDESVNAAYAVLSQGVGKFELQAGLRGENASRDFALTSAGTSYPYEYASLFPSAIANYNFNQSLSGKASYSRRIRRPGTQELNPFAQFFDVRNVFIGNPALAPEYTDSYDFGITRNGSKGTIQLSPFYRHTTNIIRIDINPVDTIDNREVTSISFRNLATSNSWGADLNGNLRLGPKFSGFAAFNVFKMVTDGGSASAIGSDAVNWMGRINVTSELTKTTVLTTAYFYRAPMQIERGRFEAQHGANLALRKRLNGDKASVTLRVNDPFGTQRFRVRAENDDVLQITERNFGARMMWLGFNYSYGRPPRVRQVQQDNSNQGSAFPPPSE
jgi:ferric enterobactin receptor